MKQILVLFLMFITNFSQAQLYASRVGHVQVKSDNKLKNIEADNYQIASVFNLETGEIQFQGLLKSFEFKLGAIDRVYSSESINVSQYPKIRFDGKMIGVENIDPSIEAEYNVTVNGTLFIWDEKRVTSAKGTVYSLGDGQLLVNSDFVMNIEEGSMKKLNKIIKEKVPTAINLSAESLGVQRDINIHLDITYNPK